MEVKPLIYYDGGLYHGIVSKNREKTIPKIEGFHILLDSSGSMGNTSQSILHMFLRDLCKREVVNEDTIVNVYVFSCRSTHYRQTIGSLLHCDPIRYPHGGTCIRGSLEQLYKELHTQKDKNLLLTLISDGIVSDNRYGEANSIIQNQIRPIIEKNNLKIFTSTFFPQWRMDGVIDGDVELASTFNSLSPLIIPLTIESGKGSYYGSRGYNINNFSNALERMNNALFSPRDQMSINFGVSLTPSGVVHTSIPLQNGSIFFSKNSPSSEFKLCERKDINLHTLIPTLQRLVGNACSTNSIEDKRILKELIKFLMVIFTEEEVNVSTIKDRIAMIKRKCGGVQSQLNALLYTLNEDRKQVGTAVAELMMGNSQTSHKLRKRQDKFRSGNEKVIHQAFEVLSKNTIQDDNSVTLITQLSLSQLTGEDGIIKELLDFLKEEDLTVDEVLYSNNSSDEIKMLIEEVLGSFSGIPIQVNNNKTHEYPVASLKVNLCPNALDNDKPVIQPLGLSDLATLRRNTGTTIQSPQIKDQSVYSSGNQVNMEAQEYNIDRIAKFQANGICPILSSGIRNQVSNEVLNALRDISNAIASISMRSSCECTTSDGFAITACTALEVGKVSQSHSSTMLKCLALSLKEDMTKVVKPSKNLKDIGEKLFNGQEVDINNSQEGTLAVLVHLLTHEDVNLVPIHVILRLLNRTAYKCLSSTDEKKLEYLENDNFPNKYYDILKRVITYFNYLIEYFKFIDRDITVEWEKINIDSMISRILTQASTYDSASDERESVLPLTNEMVETALDKFFQNHLKRIAIKKAVKIAAETEDRDTFIQLMRGELYKVKTTFGDRNLEIDVKLPKSSRIQVLNMLTKDSENYKVWYIMLGKDPCTGEDNILEENQKPIKYKKYYNEVRGILDSEEYKKLLQEAPPLIEDKPSWYNEWKPPTKPRTLRKRRRMLKIWNDMSEEEIMTKYNITNPEVIKDAKVWFSYRRKY